MARGAKDCTELGTVIYESITEEKYQSCRLTPKAQFVPVADRKATREDRERLHIPRGNGTTVTLELSPNLAIPRFDTLLRDLPWHYALRDILAEDSATRVLLRNLSKPAESPERVVYRNPVSHVVCDETFNVPGYEVPARFVLLKAEETFEESGERFRRSGVLVKSTRAIHECTLFGSEFEKDPIARKYFGRLECDTIDKLLKEFDAQRESGDLHTAENPTLLIDPNRQHGLSREHPFTKALFLEPAEKLRALVAAEREAERAKHREIASRDTQMRLDRLAKKASEFLRQQLESEELGDGEDVDNSSVQHGAFVFPTFANVLIGDERTLTYYVKSALLDKGQDTFAARVSSDDSAVVVLDSEIKIHPHKTKDDRFVGTFRVRGSSLADRVVLRVNCETLPEVQALVSVVEGPQPNRVFEQPLEFEHSEYRIREGSKKSLDLYAKYPEVVAEPTDVVVVSSDSAGIPVRGTCRLVPVAGTNYATGVVVVQGRKLHARSTITASVNAREADAAVRVVQRPPETGVQLHFELRDEDYGNFRAKWADHENKPNMLLISARHKSISRYLGPPPDFNGQQKPLFRVLLGEIVAESVCRKALVMEAKERTWEFRWSDYKDDHVIADDVFAKFQQRFREFVPDAHRIMLSDEELMKD